MSLKYNTKHTLNILDSLAEKSEVRLDFVEELHTSMLIPGSKDVCVVTVDRDVLVCDPQTGNYYGLEPLPTWGSELLSFSHDGSAMAYVDVEPESSKLAVVDVENNEILMTEGDRDVTDAKFSPNGRYLATGGEGGVRIYDAESYKLMRTISPERTIKNLSFTENELFYSTNDWNHEPQAAVFVVDLENMNQTHENPEPLAEAVHYDFAAIAPNGKSVIVCYQEALNADFTTEIIDLDGDNDLTVDLLVQQGAFSRDSSVLAVYNSKAIVFFTYPEMRELGRDRRPDVESMEFM
jgi:WD40 repeat protein